MIASDPEITVLSVIGFVLFVVCLALLILLRLTARKESGPV